MSDHNLIFADNISYCYSTGFGLSSANLIINHISFQLKRGEILAFLGPNGAGKSTTMRLLTGNLSTQSGKIEIAGYNIKKQSLQAKSCLGYLPDTPPLYKDLKVDEYLTYCAKLHNIPQQTIKQSIENVKLRCGLNKVSQRLISQLSKGIQQRIGIAQAIIHQPDIIILDEPTNGLDPVQRHEILTLIKELGTIHSVILSTHSWSDVVQAGCDKVQIINQGELVYKDSLANLNKQLQSHRLLACYINTLSPADRKEIQSIDGVLSIDEIERDKNCYRINCQKSLNSKDLQQISTQIIKLSEQVGWDLYEIKREKRSFDEVFLTLSTKQTIHS
jgi:ABC-2 type transport system ATP-binding protein